MYPWFWRKKRSDRVELHCWKANKQLTFVVFGDWPTVFNFLVAIQKKVFWRHSQPWFSRKGWNHRIEVGSVGKATMTSFFTPYESGKMTLNTSAETFSGQIYDRLFVARQLLFVKNNKFSVVNWPHREHEPYLQVWIWYNWKVGIWLRCHYNSNFLHDLNW